MTTLLALQLRVLIAAQSARHRAQDEQGQTTAEYALVLLGVAAIALLVLAWATKTSQITKLLDAVFGKLLSRVG